MITNLGRTLAIMAALSSACGRSEISREPTEGATAGSALETSWTPTVEPSALPVGSVSAQPQLTSSDHSVILSWLEQKEKTAILKFAERTTTGGWSAAQTVASGDDWFVSWADVPSVIRMRDGTLVAQWLKNVDPRIEAYDLPLSYSRDNGKSWAKPFVPHHDRTKTQHGFASLFEWPETSAGPKGLGLVWLDGRDFEINESSPEGGAMALQFASFDSAWKQTVEAVANPRVCECCPTSVAVTSDGVIAAFRDRSPKEIRDIHVTRFEGGTWSSASPVHVDNWEVDSCPVNGPSVAARGRQVVVAWFMAKDDQGHAYAAFSSDAGRTFGEPIRLDEDTSLGHVDIELLDDGSAAATWVEFTGQKGRFRTRRIEQSGKRSAAIEIAGGGAGRVSGIPRAARLGNELVFAWTESTGEEEGNQQVKGATARLGR